MWAGEAEPATSRADRRRIRLYVARVLRLRCVFGRHLAAVLLAVATGVLIPAGLVSQPAQAQVVGLEALLRSTPSDPTRSVPRRQRRDVRPSRRPDLDPVGCAGQR